MHLPQIGKTNGTGLSGFKEEYSDRYVTCDAEPLEYPHNIFITVWVEMGALGLLAFVYVLLTSIRIVSAQRKYVIVGVFYLLLHGFVDVPYFKNDLALQFWILMWLMEVD